MQVRFAIRSYRRAETLAEKTLPLLSRLGVEPEAVSIFLSDPSELDEYLNAVGQSDLGGYEWVDGALGCGPNGNFIQEWHDEGDRVVCLDDDLADLYVRRGEQTLEPISPVEFNELLFHAFAAASGGLWGVHPVPNAFFQRPTISHDLRYICGGFYGMTIRNDPGLLVDLEDKEDFERSIRWYLADGYVTRFNYVSMRTTGYRGEGGMQEERTPERVRASAEEIVRRWPDLATLNLKKKSGWAEVRLRDRRRLDEGGPSGAIVDRGSA